MSRIPRRNLQILLLFFIMLAGSVAGSILCAKYPDWNLWTNQTFRQGIGILDGQNFYCIAAPLFWLAVLAALGLSVTGLPFVPAVLFLRGAASGAVLEMLYANSGSRGKVLLLTMPYFYAASLVMLFGAREALRFSVQMTGLLCESLPEEDTVPVKLYIIRFLVLFLFMTILGVLQYFLLSRFA